MKNLIFLLFAFCFLGCVNSRYDWLCTIKYKDPTLPKQEQVVSTKQYADEFCSELEFDEDSPYLDCYCTKIPK